MLKNNFAAPVMLCKNHLVAYDNVYFKAEQLSFIWTEP